MRVPARSLPIAVGSNKVVVTARLATIIGLLLQHRADFDALEYGELVVSFSPTAVDISLRRAYERVHLVVT